MLPEITRVLSHLGSAYLPSAYLPFSAPRELSPAKLRETLMRTTCIGTFGDAGLSAVSFHSVLISSAGDGLLANITLDMTSDLEVAKAHLYVHFTVLYRLTSDHTDVVRLIVNVLENLADDVKQYMESLFGGIKTKAGDRYDVSIIRINMRDTEDLFLTK